MIDRRTTLAGMAAAGLGGARAAHATAAASRAAAASPLGHWSVDAHDLPCYVFTGDVPVHTVTPAGRTYPLDPDPVFLLGNDDLTLFVAASGRMQLVAGERGWVHVNAATAGTPGHAARLTVANGGATRTHDLLGAGGVCADAARATRTFGCGTARIRLTPQPGLTVERILSVAPSMPGHRAAPAVVVTIRLTNAGPAALDLDHVETVLGNPTLALDRPSADGVRPVVFVNTARPFAGGGIACDATATSDDPRLLTPIDTPNRYTLYPPSLVLAAADVTAATTFDHRVVDGGAVALSARSRLRLAPGATRDIVLVVALESREAAPAALPAFIAALRPSAAGAWFRAEWVAALAPLATVPDPALRGELQWDGHALLAMATYAAYYGHTFIPQGMTGDYVQDVNAGPRDHLQHAMGAACFAPGLARSSLLYTLCRMTATGALKFSVTGNGFTADSTWSPSDQSLFLFYALSEYLRITRDWTILDEVTPYLPRDAHVVGTVVDKVERAFTHLRDHVATGSHGLVRLLTGDWNDQIYIGAPPGHYEDVAESQMNSAMVMAVMPPLIAQLDAYARTRPGGQAAAILRLTGAMQTYVDTVSSAMLRDMDGRVFARRAWLGGDTVLGDDEMYLEPQSFLLQAAGFPVTRKRVLLREMERRLMAGEVLGPRQRETPHPDPRIDPGTGENGGFWYSLAGQAVAGVATFDRRAALAMLDRMTFRAAGRRYPGYWVGQWTAPDTLNAALAGDLAGLPRPMDGGAFCRMANYCAHAHAWPIYCYFRIADAASENT